MRQNRFPAPSPSRRAALAAFTAAALAPALVAGGCAKARGGPMAPPPAPVVVARTVVADVPMDVPAVGHVEAIETVSVRPRVGGQVEAVHFREGDDVRAGALLVTLDPRPFENQVAAARANLERDRARLVTARETARRYAELVAKDFVTRQQNDEASSNAEALEATVRADEAALRAAELDLDFSRIRAPLSGRAGSLLVRAGNLVKANDDKPLVVINQIRPIRVSFSVPEKVLGDVRSAQARGPLEVRATPPGAKEGEAGKVEFVENAVDASTGTVTVKAVFPNPSGTLWPGQFVDVTLVLGIEKGAMVVPAPAVLPGQKGTYVYLVKGDGTVEARPVAVARSTDRVAVLRSGLAAGDKVVTDGQLRLAPGARVEVKSEASVEPGARGEEPRKGATP